VRSDCAPTAREITDFQPAYNGKPKKSQVGKFGVKVDSLQPSVWRGKEVVGAKRANMSMPIQFQATQHIFW
jgi:hypothetical protein